VFDVLHPCSDALVLEDVWHENEPDPIDGLGRVDELVDVERPDPPGRAEAQLAVMEVDECDVVGNVVVSRPHRLHDLPGSTPAQDIEVRTGRDDAADEQRSAAEHGVILRREAQSREEPEKPTPGGVGCRPSIR